MGIRGLFWGKLMDTCRDAVGVGSTNPKKMGKGHRLYFFFLLYSNEAISLSRRRKVNITLVGPDFRSNKQSITGFAYDEEVLR
jgi:hypothetical protein